MNTYERIRDLAKEKNISIRQLEIDFGYSNGYLASWKRQNSNPKELIRLADYFNVSVDYLLGREKNNLSEEKDLAKLLDGVMSFNGEPLSEHDKEIALAYLEGKFGGK